MGSIKELLDCAEYNIKANGALGAMIGRAQIRQYQDLKAAGADDEDDVDEVLKLYPECSIKIF